MTGFLDRDFSGQFGVAPGTSSLRRIIDRVLAAGATGQREVMSFGNRVARVPTSSGVDIIRALVRQDFYTDTDTRLEEVLDSVAADTGREATHLIVTDGRRGGGAEAIAQFRRMGELAQAWAADTQRTLFAMVAADAPFQPVRGDKAGCWPAIKSEDFRCPLYVFVFAPRRGAGDLLSQLRAVSENVFVTSPLSDGAVQMEVKPAKASALLSVQRGPNLTPHLFFTASAQQDSLSVPVKLQLGNSVSRSMATDELEVQVHSSPLMASSGKAEWTLVKDFSQVWVRPGTPVRSAEDEITLPLMLRARPDVPLTRYRIDIVSVGRPSWLTSFDAPKQGDSVRTYGLSALFAQLRPIHTPISRLAVTVY